MKNLKQISIILIPAVVASMVAIFYDTCIFGIDLVVDFCFLSLRYSLIFLWPTTIALVVLFAVLNFTSLKNKSINFKYILAIIFMIIVPIASLGFLIIVENIQEKNEQNIWKEKVEDHDAISRNIEQNGGLISISNLKEEYRYNNSGKIEYIDISLDMASEMAIDTNVSLLVSGPPVGFEFFQDAKVSPSLSSIPKKVVFPVHVNGKKPLPNRKYEEEPFPIALYFRILSPEYKNKFGKDFISMKYAGENEKGWEWDYANGFLSYKNPMLKTRTYLLSEFVETE